MTRIDTVLNIPGVLHMVVDHSQVPAKTIIDVKDLHASRRVEAWWKLHAPMSAIPPTIRGLPRQNSSAGHYYYYDPTGAPSPREPVTQMPRCECGATSTGIGQHSTWCPTYNEKERY